MAEPSPGSPSNLQVPLRAADPAVVADKPVIEIEPTLGWRAVDLGELWAYRQLLAIFVWRDLKVRYRQTALGALWVMGQPMLTMLVFTVLFNRVARIEAVPGVPYPVFLLAGLLPWNLFASAVANAGNSLIGSSHLISRVYFPRLLVPAASVIGGVVDLIVNLVLLAALMIFYRALPDATILLLPLFVVMAAALALGIGLWLSALNVEYRDVRVVIPFLMQLWMFATPVVYPLRALTGKLRLFVSLNPMTGVVEAFRASVAGTEVPWMLIGYSSAAALFFLASGAFYFRRMERLFADVL